MAENLECVIWYDFGWLFSCHTLTQRWGSGRCKTVEHACNERHMLHFISNLYFPALFFEISSSGKIHIS